MKIDNIKGLVSIGQRISVGRSDSRYILSEIHKYGTDRKRTHELVFTTEGPYDHPWQQSRFVMSDIKFRDGLNRGFIQFIT